MTTQQDIRDWFVEGKQQKATHLIIVCDTFDYGDYPVFVKPTEDVHEREKHFRNASMQRVMEVYNLRLPMEEQIKKSRSFTY